MHAVRGAGAVDADADHVEADLGESGLGPALGQPGTSEASDLDLLSGPDRLQRHLGGCDDLYHLDAAGGLDPLLVG